MLVPFKRGGFDLLLSKSARISFKSRDLQFTIDIRPDLWYGCVCYLKRTS